VITLIIAVGAVGVVVTIITMCPSTSSYRSSAPSPLELQWISNHDTADKTTDVHADEIQSDCESSTHSHSYPSSLNSSSVSSDSSQSTIPFESERERQQERQQERERERQQERERRQSGSSSFSKSSRSQSTTMIFFRMLFLRCFVTRRNRRMRSFATRNSNNSNYQTRGDYGNTNSNKNINSNGANPPRRNYTSIPTNEHEMFRQLHSKSKRNLNAQSISGSSGHSPRSSVNRSLSGHIHRNHNVERTARQPTRPVITPPAIVDITRIQNEAQPLLLS